VGLDEMTNHNITGEVIIDHLYHNDTVIDNTTAEITSPDINLTIDRMRNRVTTVEVITEVDHHAGACSPTAGRLKMIRAVTEHAKGHKRPLRIQVTLKMSNVTTDVKHVPMTCHALQVSAGQQQ